jgi:hypothetical protein
LVVDKFAAGAESYPAVATPPARPEPATRDAKDEFLSKFVPTEKETGDTIDFLKTYSPNRYNAMVSNKKPVNKFVVARFLDMRRLQKDDPAGWELRLKETQKEDEIFPLAQELKADPANAALRAKITPLVKELVDLRIEEAKHRIGRLQEALTNEQKQLDNLNRPDAVDNRIKEYLSGETLFGPGPGAGPAHRHPMGAHNPATQPATQPASNAQPATPQ